MSVATEEEIRAFADRIRQELHGRVVEILLYGSYARGGRKYPGATSI
jgi:predicted nucleotidyltransferase